MFKRSPFRIAIVEPTWHMQMVGTVIDNYRLLEQLGKGGMGTVYKALDQGLNITVALKLMDRNLAQDPGFMRRFQVEAQALAKLQHPHIVGVLTIREAKEGPFIVMEYVKGGMLHDRITKQDPMSWEEAVPLLKQTLLALDHAHRGGVYHRDIKPRNILLTEEGQVKVADFGLAKILEQNDETTKTGMQAGTLYYMSPEQVKGLKFVDHRSDIYSVGMTFYEVLAGRKPFDESSSTFQILQAITNNKKFPSVSTFRPGVPKELVRIIAKAIAKKPENRFQSAREMIEAVEAIEASRHPTQPTVIVDPVLVLPWRAWRSRILLMASLVLIAILLWILAPAIFQSLPNGSDEQTAAPEPTLEKTTTTTDSTESKDSKQTNGKAAGPTPESRQQDSTNRSSDGPTQPIRTPQAQQGELDLSSTPSGATISLDDNSYGTTPQVLSVEPGTYTLTLRHTDYASYTASVTVRPGESTFHDAPLKALTGELSVQVLPWGNIYIDSVLKQEGMDRVYSDVLTVGMHLLMVEHPELGVRWEKNVRIRENEPQHLQIDLKRTVKITVVSLPVDNAEIHVDGTFTEEYTPKEIELRVGLHVIEVFKEGFSSTKQKINLEKDLNEPLTFRLKQSNNK